MKPSWYFVTFFLVFTLVACGRGGGGGNESAPFSDDFDTAGAWRVISDPEVEIAHAGGGLSIEVKVIDRVAWTIAGTEFKDGIVAVDATRISGPDDNAYGLVMRHEDDRNFYRFEVSSDGYFAVQAPQGAFGWEFLVDWTESSAIHKGQETNHLEVECQGATMIFYANGVELTRVDDDRYSKGDVGLIAGTFYVEPDVHILFDNFRVEPLKE